MFEIGIGSICFQPYFLERRVLFMVVYNSHFQKHPFRDDLPILELMLQIASFSPPKQQEAVLWLTISNHGREIISEPQKWDM